MAIFNSCVKLPEGTGSFLHLGNLMVNLGCRGHHLRWQCLHDELVVLLALEQRARLQAGMVSNKNGVT